MKIDYVFRKLVFLSRIFLLSIIYAAKLLGSESSDGFFYDNDFLYPEWSTELGFVNSDTNAESLVLSDAVSTMTEKIINRKCTPKICGLRAIINSLEATTAAFVRSTLSGPPIQCLSPVAARALLDKIQDIPVIKCPTTIQDVIINVCGRDILLNIVRPLNSMGILPIIMYFHGGGWELGSEFTFDRLIRQLSSGTNAAVVFVNYTRTPEAQFPVAIDEAYAATKYIAENAATFNLDATRLAVAGDSVGGNMATVVTMMAKAAHSPCIIYQALFYPVTQPCFNTPSYKKYAKGPWLTRAAMMHYWDLYLPNVSLRNNPLASPLRATLRELNGLPPALVITDQNDVLRCDGEWYACKLKKAGVPVKRMRFLHTIHDFMMLNPLATTPATEAAICLAQATLRQVFGT